MRDWMKWESSKPSENGLVVCLSTEGQDGPVVWLDYWFEGELSDENYTHLTPDMYYMVPEPVDLEPVEPEATASA